MGAPKHTPIPWEIMPDGDIGFRITTGGFKALACTFDGGVEWEEKGKRLPAEENAAFIVTAVNSHSRLLAEKKRLREALTDVLSQFDAISKKQHDLLVKGQTLETASLNWDEATAVSIDFSGLRAALKDTVGEG